MATEFDLEEAIAILERTPRALEGLLGGLPEPWTAVDEGADTFSAWDVVGHLLHGEHADWIPRARRILDDGERVPLDPFDRIAHRQLFRGWSLAMLLDAFAAARTSSLTELRAMDLRPEDLDRRGRHPALGTVTLRMLLATWVVHDLGHVRQASRVMAGRYRDDVGPWESYLPVLRERSPR